MLGVGVRVTNPPLNWESMQEWSPEVMVMRELEKGLLVTDEIVYADDRSLANLSETSAQVDMNYIHSTGPPRGLVSELT